MCRVDPVRPVHVVDDLGVVEYRQPLQCYHDLTAGGVELATRDGKIPVFKDKMGIRTQCWAFYDIGNYPKIILRKDGMLKECHRCE